MDAFVVDIQTVSGNHTQRMDKTQRRKEMFPLAQRTNAAILGGPDAICILVDGSNMTAPRDVQEVANQISRLARLGIHVLVYYTHMGRHFPRSWRTFQQFSTVFHPTVQVVKIAFYGQGARAMDDHFLSCLMIDLCLNLRVTEVVIASNDLKHISNEFDTGTAVSSTVGAGSNEFGCIGRCVFFMAVMFALGVIPRCPTVFSLNAQVNGIQFDKAKLNLEVDHMDIDDHIYKRACEIEDRRADKHCKDVGKWMCDNSSNLRLIWNLHLDFETRKILQEKAQKLYYAETTALGLSPHAPIVI